jgi:hypothetical protein
VVSFRKRKARGILPAVGADASERATEPQPDHSLA